MEELSKSVQALSSIASDWVAVLLFARLYLAKSCSCFLER